MNADLIYVHLETVSNLILSYGISMQDFASSLKRFPNHLLLLPPVDPDAALDTHTGFNTVSGKEEIQAYFNDKRKLARKWLDFRQSLYLEQLTSQEIAELLYLGHANTHLASPFYYKLQNDYVYLSLPDQMIKTYYRHLDHFYKVLNHSLKRHLQEKIPDTWFLFRRRASVADIDPVILRQLQPVFIDGALFAFQEVGLRQREIHIPIYYLNSRLKIVDDEWLNASQEKVAELIYDQGMQKWRLSVINESIFTQNLF